MKCFGVFRRVVLLTGLLYVPASGLLQVQPLQAQTASFRSVTGTVKDKSGAKVKGAVVHLKDDRSLAQRTFITAEDGTFRFAQVSTTTDYEIWADLDGKKTQTKTVSSFDNKKSVDFTLKMTE